MPIPRRLLALLPAVLSGCAIATPFRGPDSADAPPGETMLVAVTHAELRDDPALRRVFIRHVELVAEAMPRQHGFLGFSRRLELLGNNAWTMTAWTDPVSLMLFVEGDEHRSAMRAARPALLRARFARFTAPRGATPPSWKQALAALEQSPRVI